MGAARMRQQKPPQVPQPNQPQRPPMPGRQQTLGSTRPPAAQQAQALTPPSGEFGKWGSQANFDQALVNTGLPTQADARARLALWRKGAKGKRY